LIYNWSSSPYENLIELAWAASLILVVLVFVLNIVSRAVGGKTKL
jgi:phosphate transport system permease protein